MADLNDVNSAQSVKMIGSDSAGVEQTPVQSTTTGGLHINLRHSTGNELLVDDFYNLQTTSIEQGYSAVGKAFSAPFIGTVGTSETAFILFRNPNASDKTIKIFRIKVGGAATFKIYTLPTVTANGTTVNPINFKVVSGSQGNIGLVTSSPTTTSFGSLLNIQAVSAQSGTQPFDIHAHLILPTNTSILLTAQAGSNNTSIHCMFEWVEL